MESIKLFFINQETNHIFNFFGKVMIILLTLLVCYIIIRNSNTLRKNLELSKRINTLFAITLILQQVFLTIENIFLENNSVLNLFPIYISRLSIILLAVAMLKNKSIIKNIACYIGLFIGVYSIITNNTLKQSYMYRGLNYFGYMALVWAITYIISIEGFKLEKKLLKSVFIFANAYSILLIFLTTVLGANYNLINGTISTTYNALSQGNYIALSLLFINLSVIASYFLIKFILWEIDVNFKLEYKPIIEKDKLNKAELE